MASSSFSPPLTIPKAFGTCSGIRGKFFLRNGGRPYPVGSIFTQPTLAKTLKRIASGGIKRFYTGKIADLIHEDMKKNGGFIQKDDLARIPYPIVREPLTCRFGNMYVHTMPPPGAGRPLIEILNILKKFPVKERNPDTPQGALLLAEIIRRAQLDRRDRPFDPNFYPQLVRKDMLRTKYARQSIREILRNVNKTILSTIASEDEISGETTHLSVIDNKGMAVSLTQSIERVYGSCEASPQLGFLYNNYMSAFEYQDISHPYYLRPNAVPWASVAPTIAFKGRTPVLAVGSPGSERITSSLFQVLVRLQTQSAWAAVEAPRLHCSLAGKVSLEHTRMRSDILPALERRGLATDRRDPYSFYLGCVQLVMRQHGRFIGVADPRRDGSAGGPA